MIRALETLHKIALRLAKADMAFWVLPPLIVLLVAGTLAQRWMGLWPAIDMFFGSFIIWVGPIPLPGAYILLGILSFNLSLKFLLKTRWIWRKVGINLSHLGALILLIGGLLTAMTARESYMLIPEGQETPYTYSYTKRSLVVYEDDKKILDLSFDSIKDWDFAPLPFTITLKQWCENCEILKRKETRGYDEAKSYQAMARFMAFKNKPLDPQPENNLTGLEFTLAGSEQDGLYIAFDGMPKPIEITSADKTYTLMFGKEQRALPFTIALTDFVKDTYSGSAMARSYHSDVIIKDGDLEWPARIEMNAPLRYRGYTIFQSSFEQGPDFEATILAVVENKGRVLPYIGTLIIGIGLLLHFFIRLYNRPKEAKTK